MQNELRQKLIDIFKDRFIEDEAKIQHYGKDWTQGFKADPAAVVFPKSTDEVASLLKLCAEYRQSVVPSGGRTGLAAAAYAQNQELVISFEKMNKIIAVNADDATIVVEAGVITQSVQEAAREKGLFFALDLAAKGSSHIGGNIATNAGGTKFIKYGGMREQVLGLEVVLANGEILNINTSLRKDNSGYDLKHLFIGSEGTLGLVTKATLKLSPPPKERGLALLAIDSFAKALVILRKCYQASLTPTAFEYISHNAMEFSSSSQPPFGKAYLHYVLLEYELDPACDELIESFFSDEVCVDGTIADSSKSFHELWAYREKITERIAESSLVHKNDISLAVADLPDFVQFVESIKDHEITIVLFGHVGDGNIHVNYTIPKDSASLSHFKQKVAKIEKQLMDYIRSKSGSMSAEHGIGLLKKDLLKEFISPTKLMLMREIKKSFDPLNILNPGKIFDLS
jgi:FAD/FMN-containing dehydrogenase